MPLGELITGIDRRCASAVSSAPASDSVTPWPMKITGRRAASSQSTRARHVGLGCAPLRAPVEAVPGRLLGTSALFLEQVVGHVQVDRPGPARWSSWSRPGAAPAAASRRASAGSCASPPAGCTLVKSAWWCRLSSWNGAAVELRGRHVRGDREERGRIGLRDRERHDQVGRARAGRGQRRRRLVARPGSKPSAMWPAVCSWRGETSLTLSRTS